MTKYICITIGPIIESLVNARKTREIWGASFVFSWIMWKIVKIIKEKGKYNNIVIPYREESKLKDLESVGLYPDHLVYKCGGAEDDLNIEEIVKEVKVKLKAALKGEAEDFVEKYFQIQYFTVDLDEEELKKEGKNFLQKMDEIFYSLELRGNMREETRALSSFLPISPIGETCKPDPYGQNSGPGNDSHCRSLVEIATCCFQGDSQFRVKYNNLIQSFINKEDDEQLLQKIKELLEQEKSEKEFKSYHKYVAVVQCDGDKIGRFNQGYIDHYMERHLDKQSEDAIRMVSDSLFEWGEEASRKISDFGGLPVYAGGDDLLFFAPVVGVGKEKDGETKNVVSLLEDISCLFREKMGRLAEGDPRVHLPALSFGVTIFYYKYPLGEAQQKAFQLLYEMKKKYKGNGMNIALLKHSGSGFSVVMHFNALKRNERYCWESVFGELMKLDEKQFNEDVLSSLAYTLQRDRKIFDLIGDKEERIRQYFLCNVEGFPKKDQITANGKFRRKEDTDEEISFLLEAEKLVNLAFMEDDGAGRIEKETDRMRPVFDMLRMVKFLKGADKME